jgi:uncharacterized damage-inducible protein DinB
LYRHEAWADAEHLRAIQAHPAASQDPEIQRRLSHIHECQKWYLAQFKGERFEDAGEALPAGELGGSIEWYHKEIRKWLDSVTDDQLQWVIRFPIPGEPGTPLPEALLQVVMHSQYHRGQNAKRLRELGGEPPLTDYIWWVLKGRPEPCSVADR